MILCVILGLASAIATSDITLEGFGLLGNKNNHNPLKEAFLHFINAAKNHQEEFPIKIVRHDNQYFYSSVHKQQESALFGSKGSNRSLSRFVQTNEKNVYGKNKAQGYDQRLDPVHPIIKELLTQLDSEKWISKILITQNNGKYTVKKFGMGHTIYRGFNNAAHISTLGVYHPDWQ